MSKQFPTNFTADWFTSNAQEWLDVLGHLRYRPAKGLEIGSYEGRSAHWLMQNILVHPDSRLTCIDSWDGSDPCLGNYTLTAEAMFDDNLREFSGKLRKLKGSSVGHLPRLRSEDWNENFYDFVFIDGDHEGYSALIDLVLVWPLVKPGGWLAFDDYLWDGVGYSLTRLPSDAMNAWLSLRPPGVTEQKMVGRVMFVRKAAE